TLRAAGRLHALRPAPARLQGHTGRTRPAHPDDVDLGLVGRPRLVGRREVTHLQTGHGTLLASWTNLGNDPNPGLAPVKSQPPSTFVVSAREATLSGTGRFSEGGTLGNRDAR